MGINNVIVYVREGADPAVDRVVTEYGGSRTTLVGSDPAASVTTAVEAADGGADRIELCGAHGPLLHARVREAVNDRVPVGAVMFGFESLTGVADYKARFGNEFLREAFIYIQPGSDPAVDRTVTANDHVRSIFVAVPDASAAPAVAVQLVDGEGVRLIELFGGFEPGDAARVIEAIDARAPVGLPSYGYAGATAR
ncbi:MAG: hypothetical protein GEV03_12075 [Streptosporangiales bacterium]|nr:hypothetical protein [Streptosporangiales bacterium]